MNEFDPEAYTKLCSQCQEPADQPDVGPDARIQLGLYLKYGISATIAAASVAGLAAKVDLASVIKPPVRAVSAPAPEPFPEGKIRLVWRDPQWVACQDPVSGDLFDLQVNSVLLAESPDELIAAGLRGSDAVEIGVPNVRQDKCFAEAGLFADSSKYSIDPLKLR